MSGFLRIRICWFIIDKRFWVLARTRGRAVTFDPQYDTSLDLLTQAFPWAYHLLFLVLRGPCSLHVQQWKLLDLKPFWGPSSVPNHLCRSLGLVAQNRPSWLWDTRAVAPVLVGRPLNLAWRHRSQSPEILHRLPHGLRQQNQDTKDLRQQYQALTNSPVSGACSVRPTLKEQQLSPLSTFYSLISLPIRILRPDSF